METDDRKNRRYGMKLISIWLTPAEQESLKASVKNADIYGINIVEILETASKRGDVLWTK